MNTRHVTVTKEPGECFGFVIHSSLRADDTFKVGNLIKSFILIIIRDLFTYYVSKNVSQLPLASHVLTSSV